MLVFRFSAMGDVALTLPVLKSVLYSYPDISILLVTRKAFAPLFTGNERLEVFPADFGGEYKGIQGLLKLYVKLRTRYNYTAVIDLHDVLRTKLLNFLFKLTGKPVYKINKGRRDKKRLIHGMAFSPLPSATERYLSVFSEAGYSTELLSPPYLSFLQNKKQDGKMPVRIGIAPCARHALKEWPVESMVALMHLIREKHNARFYLFGGKDEKETLAQIAGQVEETSIEALALPLQEQMALMSGMHLMISMDSANMHLAALAGIPLVVIWGATHPFAGFAPTGEHEKGFVQISKDELSCRPCTVYGKGTCRRGDHACMERITPEMVYQKILALGIPEFSV